MTQLHPELSRRRRQSVAAALLVLWLAAGPPAFAQAEAVGITVEISIRASAPLFAASSEASSEASSNASSHSTAAHASGHSAQCNADNDCPSASECLEGECVRWAGECTVNKDCPNQTRCEWDPSGAGHCAKAPLAAAATPGERVGASSPELSPPPAEAVPAPPPFSVQQCSTDEACGAGRTCVDGGCLFSPPAPPAARPEDAPRNPLRPPDPSSSLLRRGSELYLRERGVELREELALGRGPVLSSLAAMRGVDARAFGRLMRSHRAELVQLIGEGAGPDWAGRFLQRVEALEEECRRS